MVSASGSLTPGSRVGDRYNVLEKLGHGSNGQVYRAFDEHLGTEVAIKLLTPKAGTIATWDEAQILEQLRSEYLLQVINADTDPNSDIRYITTPVMRGGDVANAACPVGVDTRQASLWGQQIAHGLERVHAAGLVHRDIKPANVYLDGSGNALLGDLGMAAKVDSSGLAAPDGTPATAAPEAIAGHRHCSVYSDIYSLAATVFYFLSGEYPVDHRTGLRDLLDKAAKGDRRKIRDLAPHVSRSVGRVIERSLSIDPTMRAASALDFANQLAGARHYTRTWRRVVPHPGHEQCFEALPTGKLRALAVCTVIDSSTGGYNIEVVSAGGRRLRRAEKTSVPRSSLLVELRKTIEAI